MSDRGGDHGVADRPDGAVAPTSGPVVTDPAGKPQGASADRLPAPAPIPAATKPVVAPGPATSRPAAAAPTTTTSAVVAPNASFELWASRLTGRVPDLLRRVPFTATIVLGTLLVGLVARTVWSPIWRERWFAEIAYGTPALREGKLWTCLLYTSPSPRDRG